MASASPARTAALSLLGKRRRRNARVRDIARSDRAFGTLQPADRALAFRLALGATAAQGFLDQVIDERLRRASSLEPRVRDALRLSAFELLYLDTPCAVCASQGVELVRSVAPRAAGLANAVLRRLARELRPQVREARQRLLVPLADDAPLALDDLVLVSALPAWLVSRFMDERGPAFARTLCLSQLEPAPTFVAANGLRHTPDSLAGLLVDVGLAPVPLEGLPGSFALGQANQAALSDLLDRADLMVADLSAQMVCRLSAPPAPCELLEVGQGRGTKSLLVATGTGVCHPSALVGLDSVKYKVELAQRRMRAAGVGQTVSCLHLDALRLGDDSGLPTEVERHFGVVLVDAPCSGTGTMRRHPEIASALTASDVSSLATLQLGILKAAAARVAAGGALVYSTCSVLREEDEQVVQAFLDSEEGRAFRVDPVTQAPACQSDPNLGRLVREHQTADGCFLATPGMQGADGHFCARLVRL